MPNIFRDIPLNMSDEACETLLRSDDARIERIVSSAHASPDGFWYDQDQSEWVIVLQGAARLLINDETIELTVGDYIFIPAHTRHRVEWTTPDEPTIWLAVHF